MYRKIKQKVQRVAMHALHPPLPTLTFSPINILLWYGWASQVAQQESICLLIQEMQEMHVRSLGWEVPLKTFFPERGNANPFQYSCLGMDRGVWRAMVHGVTKRGT